MLSFHFPPSPTAVWPSSARAFSTAFLTHSPMEMRFWSVIALILAKVSPENAIVKGLMYVAVFMILAPPMTYKFQDIYLIIYLFWEDGKISDGFFS